MTHTSNANDAATHQITRNSSQNDPLHDDPGFELFAKDKWFDDFGELMTAKSAWTSAKTYYQANPERLLHAAPASSSNADTAIPRELQLALTALGTPVDAQTLAVVAQLWPLILDEKTKAANLEAEQLWSTLLRVGNYLDIDPQASRSAPGKPSDVFIEAIEKYVQDAPLREAKLTLKLQEAAQLGKAAAKQIQQAKAKLARSARSADENAHWLNRVFGYFGKSKP